VLSRLRSAAGTAKRVATVAKQEEVTFLAAAVAYSAFVSVIRAVVLALVAATTFGGERLATLVLESASQFFTESGQDVLLTALTASEGRGSATIAGLLFLVWGSLKGFRALDTAFATVYGTKQQNSLPDQLIDSLVVILGIGLTMVLMFVMAGLLAVLNLGPAVELLGVLSLPILLTGAFLPIFYRFPDTDVTVREVLPGAAVAGVGWAAMQAVFQIYASVASTSAYGIVGGVILLVTWLYISGAVIILGAVVNVVLAENRVPGSDQTSVSARQEVGVSANRQFQGEWEPASARMTERDPRGAPDVNELADDVEELRAELERFESDVERKTVDRPQLESDLKAYVRSRMRQGKARGWGPYLILLYGTAMSLGAFYWLEGWVAIAAMLVAFTSSLGIYVIFVLFGGIIAAGTTAAGVADRLRSR
jgi:YihY family inner membrane protein